METLRNIQSYVPADCTLIHADTSTFQEPMLGLREILTGTAYATLKNYQSAVDAYNLCISKRNNVIDDAMHISAFAHYELATLLLHCNRNVSKTEITRLI